MRLVMGVSVVATLGFMACARPPEPRPAGGPPALAAVVRVRGPNKIEVPVAVVNPTATPFRCAAWHGRELALATGVLYRDGREVEDALRVTVDEASLTMDDVLVVPPGGVGRLIYRPLYSGVRPGLYELRLRYVSGTGPAAPGHPELTNATFEQRIVLDVVAE